MAATGSGGGYSEETYLEAYMENLSTLPHDLRRTLDLLKDLDHTADLPRLVELHRAYIQHVEEKVLQLQVVETTKEHESSDGDESATATSTYGVRAPAQAAGDGKVVIPTTSDLFTYTYSDTYPEIRRLQKSCLQKADEKVAVAQQAYEMIDAQIQRLDTDMRAMEKILQAMGEYETVVVTTTKPTDLAACQVTPGSEWILAKIIEFDDVNGTYKLADEDVESNKVFDLPEQQVVVLSGTTERLQKDDKIYAVYPDTTSFYPATVTQAPKKGSSTVVVNFADDADELGITHDKTVHIQHVMPPPH